MNFRSPYSGDAKRIVVHGHSIRRNVHSHHAAARSFQHLNSQLPEQAKTNDSNDLAEFDLRHSNSVQCDRSDRGERGLFQADRRALW